MAEQQIAQQQLMQKIISVMATGHSNQQVFKHVENATVLAEKMQKSGFATVSNEVAGKKGVQIFSQAPNDVSYADKWPTASAGAANCSSHSKDYVKAATAATVTPAVARAQDSKPSFASIFVASSTSTKDSFKGLPIPYFKGDMPAVIISEEDYLEALKSCKFNLIGRIILPKGTSPVKTIDLHKKLSTIWSL
ncbi:hypothetical protein LguiA_035684 [Lonicera macranthoides]